MAEIRINGAVTYLSDKYEYYLTWEETNQNTVNNTSDVTLRAYARRKSNYTSYTEAGTSQLQIDGNNNAKETGKTIDLQANTSPQLLDTHTRTITHNADGSKSIVVKGGEAVASGSGILGANDSSFSPYKGTASATITLATIPREAQLTSVITFVIGNDLPITFSNPGLFYVQAKTYTYNAGTSTWTLRKTENLGNGVDATLDLSTIASDIYAEIPTALSDAIKVELLTFTDNTYTSQIGSTKSYTGTATVDQTANKPTFTTFTVGNYTKSVVVNADRTTQVTDLVSSDQTVIKYVSKARAVITTTNKALPATPGGVNNSASIIKYRFSDGIKTPVEATYSAIATVNIDLDEIQSKDFTVTAIDSRGLEKSVTVSVTTLKDWFAPVLGSIVITRSALPSTDVKLQFAGTYFDDTFGAQSNTVASNGTLMRYRYKETGGAYGSWIAITPTDTSGELSYGAGAGTILESGDNETGGAVAFDNAKTYVIEVEVYDRLKSVVVSATIPRGTPLMDWTQDGIAILGQHSGTPGNALEANGKILEDGEWVQDTMDNKDDVLLEYIRTGWYPLTGVTATPRVQTYTNDPASGSNIVLNMADTSGFEVGEVVWVWSSAGNEVATITSISANTSITVNALALNHTTTGRAVYEWTANYVFIIDTNTDQSANVQVGDKIKFTQTTVKYGIVVKVDGTRLWVFGGTDYNFAGSVGITDIYVGRGETPYGFPHNPHKWQIELTDTANNAQANPTTGTVYNLGSLQQSVPIGHWIMNLKGFVSGTRTSTGGVFLFLGLSTANNSFSDNALLARFHFAVVNSANSGNTMFMSGQDIITTARTTYYINEEAIGTNLTELKLDGSLVTTILTLECAYL